MTGHVNWVKRSASRVRVVTIFYMVLAGAISFGAGYVDPDPVLFQI